MSDKGRKDPRESIERACGDLRRFAADGYTVGRYAVIPDLERPARGAAKVEVGIRIVIELTPIA